jgi:hypothetical protein
VVIWSAFPTCAYGFQISNVYDILALLCCLCFSLRNLCPHSSACLCLHYRGRRSKKSLKDRDSDALGRVTAVVTPTTAAADPSASTTASTTATTTSTQYTVKWIVGGSSSGLQREWLKATTAEKEGFIANDNGNGSISSGTIVIGGHLSRRAARIPKPTMASPATATTTNKKKAPKVAVNYKAAAPAAKPAAAASKRKSMDSLSSTGATATSRSSTIKTAPTTSSGMAQGKGKKRKLVETAAATTTAANAAVAVPSTAPALSPPPQLLQQPSLLLSSATTTAMNLYERQRREFDRIVTRLEKLDKFGWFWDEAPENFVENYEKKKTPPKQTLTTTMIAAKSKDGVENPEDASIVDDAEKPFSAKAEAGAVPSVSTTHDDAVLSSVFPSHAPYNWEMIRRRREHGRYVLDRVKVAEQEREKLLQPYFEWKKEQEQKQQQQQQLAEQKALTISKMGKRKRSPTKKGLAPTIATAATTGQKEQTSGVNKAIVQKEQQRTKQVKNYPRVLHPKGVHWDLFKSDVFAMIDAAIAREDKEEGGTGGRGSLPAAANKVREAVLQACERTGERHTREMQLADDRHFFVQILEQTPNTEAAMQSWRQSAFPERIYERLSGDVVSAGLEELDERIATYELKTSLPDCFVGLSYRYDDTGQSEAWMQSVVEETEANTLHKNKSKKLSSSSSSIKNNTSNNDKTMAQKKTSEERRQVAMALAAAGDGVRRAQIASSMNSLLIGVQDRVMTEWGVLKQPELRSANWLATATTSDDDHLNDNNNNSNNSSDNHVAMMAAQSDDNRSSNKDGSDDTKLAATDSKPMGESEPMEVSSNNGIVNRQEQTTHATSDFGSESCDTRTKPMKESSADGKGGDTVCTTGNEQIESTSRSTCANVTVHATDAPVTPEASPEILEQPVWGMDCYTVCLWQEQRFTCLL